MTIQRAVRLLAFSLLFTSCAKKSADAPAAPVVPVVAEMKQTRTTEETPAVSGSALVTVDDAQPAPIPAKPAGSLISEVTLNKASLLGRSFNYSSSLQFSSIVDGDISTAMMGLSLGEVPAMFNIMNDKLQLVTDGRLNFESDVNHPSRLIYEFQILSQTADTITIRADRPSPISDTFMFGNKNKVPVRYSFLRSMEYAAADELMMMEGTVELTDGSIGEFIESFRPRERTVRADVKVLYNDPELTPEAERYDFLDSGDVYVAKPGKPEVRVKTKAANRWDLSNGQPVKWYITKNVPDEYLETIKNGVEGWNRYSRAMGTPDLIKFEGRLPDGIKVGDPRYNLIVWDTVQDAGAAYESQNADPITGVQSHSMIYIPLAWVNIGKDYWNKFAPETQSPGEARAAKVQKLLKERSFLGRRVPVNCMDSADLHLTLAAQENPADFAKGLLRGVVFHEVGHSFGLGHNFKGSLSYDSDDAKKPFSNSIMDYNDYNEEEAAYNDLHSADGPLLEYDRQIISFLYHDGKDIKDSDPELPACADDVADSTAAGIDPLCIRYDIGADPTKEALKSLALFSVEGSKRGVMTALDAKKVTDSLIPLPPAASVKTKKDLLTAIAKAQAFINGTVGIYISASANSFGYLGSSALKSLKVFQKDVLPEEGGYDENEMRARAAQVLEVGATMDEFPAPTRAAVMAGKVAVVQYLQTTAFVSGLPRDAQQALMDKLSPALDKLLVVDVQTAILSKMRTRFIGAIVSTPTAPLGFVQANGKSVDIEQVVLQALEYMSSQNTGSVARPVAERAAALAALKSYKRSESFQNVADRVIKALNLEISTSTDALKREAARALLAAFTKVDAPAETKADK